jgi:hypothetical protein
MVEELFLDGGGDGQRALAVGAGDEAWAAPVEADLRRTPRRNRAMTGTA